LILLTVALHAQDEKTKEGTERQLVRLMQHGVFTIGTVEPLIRAIQAVSGKESKEDKQSVRAGFYLLQLAFGDGSAGTPLPVSSQKGRQLCKYAEAEYWGSIAGNQACY
jgi:hypothetical protein